MDSAEKAWWALFREAKRLVREMRRFFTLPKTPYAIKIWGRVQVSFWTFMSLLTSYFVLPLIIQLVRVLRY